jgi:hypothetical protein
MSNDPLALSNEFTGPPQEAARDGAARDLTEIAAAIGRIEAEIGAGATPAPDIFAPIERIADVAFVLHERSVEATLCDELDAALREISNARARSEPAAERVRKAAEMLHALGSRVAEMIALASAKPSADASAADNTAAGRSGTPLSMESDGAAACEGVIEDGVALRGALFDLDAEQTEYLAQAVAALVASLPTLADAPGPDGDPQSGPDRQAAAGEGTSSAAAASEQQSTADILPALDLVTVPSANHNDERPQPDISRAVPSAAAADALAAVRALSEEELIALFS